MRQAKSQTQAITSVCHPTDKPEDSYLVQTIRIGCEICGPTEIQIYGHHIPVVLRALQKALEMYPNLCKEQTVEVASNTVNLVNQPEGKM